MDYFNKRNREYKHSNVGRNVEILFIIVLILIFSIFSIYTILFGAEVYKNIGKGIDEEFKESIPFYYVYNKVHEGDISGGVWTIDKGDTSILAIAQEYDDEKYVTYIYSYEGKLMELFISAEDELVFKNGEVIMETYPIKFSNSKENLIKMDMYEKGKTPSEDLIKTTFVGLRSEV